MTKSKKSKYFNNRRYSWYWKKYELFARTFIEKKPKDIKVCSLLSKPSRREVDVKIDFLGFEVPDRFIIGYGFDDEEGFFRNIPYIGYR